MQSYQQVQEAEQAQKIMDTQKAEAAVVAVELADVAVIFLFKQFLLELLEGFGHTILFPIAAGASLIRAMLAIREAALEKNNNKKKAVIRAVVETVAALGICTATIGTLFATATFVLVGPIIFTAVLAAKTLFHLGAAVYYGVRSLKSKNKQEKQAAIQEMRKNLIMAAATALTTVASGLVFIAHKLSFGFLGVIGAAVGATYAMYRGLTLQVAKPRVMSKGKGLVTNNMTSMPHSNRTLKGRGVALSITPPDSPTENFEKEFKDIEEIEADMAALLKEQDMLLLPLISPQENSRIASTSTAAILQSTIPPLAERKKEFKPVVRQSKQQILDRLKQELISKRNFILKGLVTLETVMGGQNAFDKIPRTLNETQVGAAPIPVYWWRVLYARESRQTGLPRELIVQVDAAITDYNELVEQHQELLQNDRYDQVIADEQAKKDDELQKELEEAEFRRKTGMGKSEARDIGHLAGLGCGNSNYSN